MTAFGPAHPVRMLPQRFEPLVPLDQLHPHPANFNDGDLGLLAGLMAANGLAGAVLAQESTGIIFDGKTRLDTARELGLPGLPVLWVDCTDDERDRFLSSWNEACRRGLNDLAKQVAFLQAMAVTPRGLAGCGFDGDDLDAMTARLRALAAGPGPGGDGTGELPPAFQCPECGHVGTGDWTVQLDAVH